LSGRRQSGSPARDPTGAPAAASTDRSAIAMSR
jgi:hypothetical protein